MDFGFLKTKSDLSAAGSAMSEGDHGNLTNRGSRVAHVAPAAVKRLPLFGRGLWRDQVNLFTGWDSKAEDMKIQDMFDLDSE